MAGYTKLMRLTNTGASFITDEYLKNPEPDPIILPEAVDQLPQNISLTNFNRAVDEVMQRFPDDPPAGDAWLSEEIHKALGLPRGIAMDIRVWQFLTCIAHPEYVRYRWGKNDKVSKERFLGGIKRNAFARLWWAAEIMKNGEDYSGIAPCFASQDLYEAVFGRSFSKFPSAAKAFVEGVKNQERAVVREVAKDFNFMLSTFVLEDLPEEQVKSLVGERIALRAAAQGAS